MSMVGASSLSELQETRWPITEAQAGLWYAQRMDPGNPVFNTGQFTVLDGDLDVARFAAAVAQVMREADGLALRVCDDAAQPMVTVDARLRPSLEIVDLCGQAQPREAAMAAMREDMARPVDPAHGPLVRQVLYCVAPQCHLWYQRVHHIVIDSYGMSLIDGRVAQCYRHGTDAGHAALAPLSLVMQEDARYRASEQWQKDRAYWNAAFAQREPVASLAEGTALSAHEFHQCEMALDDGTGALLRAREAASGVSWPDVLLALCAAYVARHTGQREAVLGVPYMGRMGNPSARVPAMVMNIMPVGLDIAEDVPLDQFLAAAARMLRQARRHGRYRSEQLRRDLGLLGGSRRLFGPLVNVLPFTADPDAFPGLKAVTQVMCAGPVDDLTITFRADAAANGLTLILEANPALYRRETVQAHLQRLRDFLSRALSAATLAEVPTLTQAEHRRWVEEVNATQTPVPRTTLAALIASTMRAHPEAPALEFAGRVLSYAALDRASAALARHLAAQGVGRGDIVALALPRSVELIVALLGVMRAGAAYLPLDLQHPASRLQIILDSAAPRMLLTLSHARAALPPFDATLALDDPQQAAWLWREDAGDDGAAGMPEAPQPDDAAYVLYTSGSTGAPKGVVVEHDAIVNRLAWMQQHYGIGPQDRILQKTPATFDVSVWEFFLPLMAGATLVVAPPEAHRDPAWLARILRDCRISVLHFVPSMLAAFLEEPGARGLSPRLVFCSGEALPAALRDRFHQVLAAELHNLYGPTEAAVDVTWWPASRHDASQPVPIGFPVWNTGMYVLDAHLRPVPPGVIGQLYIAGRQLARGYLGRPDLTAQRFVPDPFHPAPARMYDTGDLACWRDDGALVYMGRSDHQVKIRGQRIELGEIEAVLAAAPGVQQVVALARSDPPGDAQLVAYVTLEGAALAPEASDAAEHAANGRGRDEHIQAVLRDFAAARLPEVMQPAAFVVMDALPVTANGKLDRKALPAPQGGAQRQGRTPTPGAEQQLAALFADILGLSGPVFADDDFFVLGGHSLLAARLAAQVRERWGLAGLTLGAIFEHATVARLARHLDAITLQPEQAGDADLGGGFGPLVTLRNSDAGRPALFCVHPAGGIGWCYGALARAVAPQRQVIGLQARSLHPETDTNPWPQTLQAMACDYVDRLLAAQPRGPYHLLGWSVGGIIAHAMAVELQRRGLQTGLLCMLDAYPGDCWRDQPEPPPDAVYKALLHIAGYDPLSLNDLPLNRDAVVEFLRRSGHPLGELPDGQLDGVIDTVAQNNRMVRAHHHGAFHGALLYFRAALDHQGQDLSAAHWLPYVQSLQAHDIPALHAHLTGSAAVAQLAPDLNAALLRADAAGEQALPGGAA